MSTEQDVKRPLVCMDECPKQLIGETRVPLPVKPGPACLFWNTCGTGPVIFSCFRRLWKAGEGLKSPGGGTCKDWAKQIRQTADEDLPLAKKIILVMDNLNTGIVLHRCMRHFR
jgi:hypothetical protein